MYNSNKVFNVTSAINVGIKNKYQLDVLFIIKHLAGILNYNFHNNID